MRPMPLSATRQTHITYAQSRHLDTAIGLDPLFHRVRARRWTSSRTYTRTSPWLPGCYSKPEHRSGARKFKPRAFRCKTIWVHSRNPRSCAQQVSNLRYSNPMVNKSFKFHIFTIINSQYWMFFYKIKKHKIMLNTFSRSLTIWEPAIETWGQEINGAVTNWLGERIDTAEQLPIFEIILLTLADYHYSSVKNNLLTLSPSLTDFSTLK